MCWLNAEMIEPATRGMTRGSPTIRVVSGLGLFGLAICAVVLALTVRAKDPNGLEQLGVWIAQATLAIFSLMFLVLGTLEVSLRSRSWPSKIALCATLLAAWWIASSPPAPLWLALAPLAVAGLLWRASAAPQERLP
jgi:hypothetical protein